jgi:excinuclease UvrABC nuclease subunit
VVDGGIAQKNAVEKVLQNKALNIEVVAVVKDEHHKPKEKLKKEILLANAEAHRFAISFHKKLRGKLL